jgi:hypothetical protein
MNKREYMLMTISIFMGVLLATYQNCAPSNLPANNGAAQTGVVADPVQEPAH